MELIKIITSAAQEAFIHVGLLLAIVILLFGFLDYKTGGNIVNIVERNKKIQPIVGAILGAIPGCGGSIILIPLYVKNKVSFGALVATLVASMGDAAFILISTDIKSYIWVTIISFVTAVVCGYLFDMLNLDKKLKLRKNKLHTCSCTKEKEEEIKKNLCSTKHIGHEENDEIDHALHHVEKRRISSLGHKFIHSIGYKLFYLLIMLGLAVNLINGEGLVHNHSHSDLSSYTQEHTHEHDHEHEDENVEEDIHTHEHDHEHEDENVEEDIHTHEHDHEHEGENTIEDTHTHDHEHEEVNSTECTHTHDHSHNHEGEHTSEEAHTHNHEILSIESLISVLGVTLSIVYTILSKKYLKNSTHEEVESKIFSFKEMIIHSASEAAFVITWIFVGYVIYDIGVMALGGEEVLNSILFVNGIVSVVIGALLGIIPGCGVQVIFISLYSKGVIPFAALVANSISQDGDALFPLIAMDKKSALWATILTTIPAIAIGIIVYTIMH